MSNSKQLLEAQPIDEVLSEVNITQDTFTDDNGKVVTYNRVEFKFVNGDIAFCKASPELRASVYYATEYIKKAK